MLHNKIKLTMRKAIMKLLEKNNRTITQKVD